MSLLRVCAHFVAVGFAVGVVCGLAGYGLLAAAGVLEALQDELAGQYEEPLT